MDQELGGDAADTLARVGRHWGWVLAFGVVTVLVGLLVLVWPGPTIVVVAVLFGIQLVVAGIYRFVAALAAGEESGSTRVLFALLGAAAHPDNDRRAGAAVWHLLDRQRRRRSVHGLVEPRDAGPRLDRGNGCPQHRHRCGRAGLPSHLIGDAGDTPRYLAARPRGHADRAGVPTPLGRLESVPSGKPARRFGDFRAHLALGRGGSWHDKRAGLPAGPKYTESQAPPTMPRG